MKPLERGFFCYCCLVYLFGKYACSAQSLLLADWGYHIRCKGSNSGHVLQSKCPAHCLWLQFCKGFIALDEFLEGMIHPGLSLYGLFGASAITEVAFISGSAISGYFLLSFGSESCGMIPWPGSLFLWLWNWIMPLFAKCHRPDVQLLCWWILDYDHKQRLSAMQLWPQVIS